MKILKYLLDTSDDADLNFTVLLIVQQHYSLVDITLRYSVKCFLVRMSYVGSGLEGFQPIRQAFPEC